MPVPLARTVSVATLHTLRLPSFPLPGAFYAPSWRLSFGQLRLSHPTHTSCFSADVVGVRDRKGQRAPGNDLRQPEDREITMKNDEGRDRARDREGEES
jgi:hypothetical protein